MSIIDPTRVMTFRTTDILFGRIMNELSSYDASGLIDKNTFYTFIKEILHNLDAAVYAEEDCILDVNNFNVKLPDNFVQFWLAYSCFPCDDYYQCKAGFDPRTDITLYNLIDGSPYKDYDPSLQAPDKGWTYDIECPSQMDLTSKIAVRYYIKGGNEYNFTFNRPTLLSFGTVPSRDVCDGNSPCFRSGSPDKIIIDHSKFLWTNFAKGNIYMQYYGMPVDRVTRLPLIPDNPNIEKAAEFYIEYRLLRKWYLNNQLPDLERKVAMVKADYDFAFAEALSECKTPSFQAMINMRNINRKRLRKFQLNDYNYQYTL